MLFQRMMMIASVAVLLVAAATALAWDWSIDVIYQMDGAATYDSFGHSVAGAGDVNNDGYDDFIVGAYGADPGGLDGAGSAYVYSGQDASLLYQKDGAATNGAFGVSVDGAGDVNNDGYDDFIVLSRAGEPAKSGTAYVFSGLDGSLLYQIDAAAMEEWNGPVAGAGDVNNDGYDDFMIGASYASPGGLQWAGTVYIHSGFDGTLLYQKDGAAAYDHFGASADGAGDVNNDGYDDFIVGAAVVNSAYVYSGQDGSLLYQKDGAGSGDRLGESVAGAGDVNNDGYDDFVVGASSTSPGGIPGGGSGYVYSGLDGSLLYQKDGTQAYGNFGLCVAGAGDVDGDGYDDFIIATELGDPSGLVEAGWAYVYSGRDGSLLHRQDGAAGGDRLGRSVASAGNINDDEYAEILIGAPSADPGGLSSAGSVYVISISYSFPTSITDVPDDQGKQVRLWWGAPMPGDSTVTSFAIFRRQDAAKAVLTPPPVAAWATTMPEGNWDYVTSVPAFGDSTYQTVVPTLIDSSITAGMQYSVFFVRMASDNPLDFLDSPIDSGYSVDNIAPAPPLGLLASGDGSSVTLTWEQVTDPDFQYYWVYRDVTPAFVPDPSKRLGATIELTVVDNDASAGSPVYYKVTAVDVGGNEGDPSNEVSGTFCACDCHGDPQCDGVTNVLDVVNAVNVAFRSGADITDPNGACPRVTTDVDCNGVTNVLDVVHFVNVAFRDADPAAQFCDACL